MGRFAIGTSALGKSFGFDVNVFRETPGPQRIKAWSPGEGRVAWGIVAVFCLLTRYKGSIVSMFNEVEGTLT